MSARIDIAPNSHMDRNSEISNLEERVVSASVAYREAANAMANKLDTDWPSLLPLCEAWGKAVDALIAAREKVEHSRPDVPFPHYICPVCDDWFHKPFKFCKCPS